MKVAGSIFLVALAALTLSLLACGPTSAHDDTPDPTHDFTVYVKEPNGTVTRFDHIYEWDAHGEGRWIKLYKTSREGFCAISMQNVVWVSERMPN